MPGKFVPFDLKEAIMEEIYSVLRDSVVGGEPEFRYLKEKLDGTLRGSIMCTTELEAYKEGYKAGFRDGLQHRGLEETDP